MLILIAAISTIAGCNTDTPPTAKSVKFISGAMTQNLSIITV